MGSRILLLAQWGFLLLYAKFGYNATGDAEAHWARLFYIVNQIIICGWVYMMYTKKREYYKESAKTAFWFNLFLVILWSQHYLPPVHYIVHYCGILIPLLSYTTLYLIITYLINFRK